MYDTTLRIAHDILVIGGALAMIVFVFILIVTAVISVNISRLVTRAVKTVKFVSETIITPFSYISAFLAKRQAKSEKEEEKPSASSRRRKS